MDGIGSHGHDIPPPLPPNVIHLGYTGTRLGMSAAQKERLERILSSKEWGLTDILHFHHGDCIGSDEQAHDIARLYNWFIEGHPCTLNRLRAWCVCDRTHHPLPPLERNRRIVDKASFLIATPAETREVIRSGTWATVRQAVRVGKGEACMVIFPDGSVKTALDAISTL
jgi:hypothetical protein